MSMNAPLSRIHIGCSGWNYRHWRGAFYPEDLPAKGWFAYYARQFDTVEINNSFYRLPKAETFDAWREQAPAGFCYAVKANRFITQAKKLKDCQEPLARMIAPTRHLRSEQHTSELQSLMRISSAVFCLKKNTQQHTVTIIYINA